VNQFRNRELIVVTGKGGVGRTTLSAAIGVAAASAGNRTVICEVSGQQNIPAAFGVAAQPLGSETTLGPNLASITIDPDTALQEWIRAQAGAAVGRALGASRSFAHFVAAAPGAREMVTITKAWELGPGRRWGRGKVEHDLVVLDAPASGHGTAMLTAPRTFADIAGSGPVKEQSERVWDLLTDPIRSMLVAVTTLAELPVSETVELNSWLKEKLDRPLDLVVANRIGPPGFSRSEMNLISSAVDSEALPSGAAKAAELNSARASIESAHLAELQSGLDAQTTVIRLPETSADTESSVLVEQLAQELTKSLPN